MLKNILHISISNKRMCYIEAISDKYKQEYK